MPVPITTRVEKPWGYERIWAHTDSYVGKLIHIEEGCSLSLQYHNEKEETLFLQSGTLLLMVVEGGEERIVTMHPEDVYHIPPGTVHRMTAAGGPANVIEVSTNHLNDVVRLSDDYGRTDIGAEAHSQLAECGA